VTSETGEDAALFGSLLRHTGSPPTAGIDASRQPEMDFGNSGVIRLGGNWIMRQLARKRGTL